MTKTNDILTDTSADISKSKLQVISTENPNVWDWRRCLVDGGVIPATTTDNSGWSWNVHPYTEYAGLDIIETGDYSMLVKGVDPKHKIVAVKDIKVVESIDTPEGTILYFDEKLPDELRYYNVIYAKVKIWHDFYEEYLKLRDSLTGISIRNDHNFILTSDISSK